MKIIGCQLIKNEKGFYWNFLGGFAKSKEGKTTQKKKSVPPDPVWLEPDYLPNISEDVNKLNLFTVEELRWLAPKTVFVYDTEVYLNYFLIAFMEAQSKKSFYFEMYMGNKLDIDGINWFLDNFSFVGFNSINYDIPIISAALKGATTIKLKEISDKIIVEGIRPFEILRENKIKRKQFDNIDLVEVAPLKASLKIYGGRVHTRRMQDLPFHPNLALNTKQRDITRWYCINDNIQTLELYKKLEREIDLRKQIGPEYGVDLRSRSDAQIAEAVIGKSIEYRTGYAPKRPGAIEVGTTLQYNPPQWLHFDTPMLSQLLQIIKSHKFIINEKGRVDGGDFFKKLKIPINKQEYTLGIGGLHSTEKKTTIRATDDFLILERDVTSYYPFIILTQGLYPPNIGPSFLEIYESIVARRLEAKAKGDKLIADSLKITINGSFGKLSSPFSILYSPNLLIQVTLSGQLYLLRLIELLELNNIPVVSANTDGISAYVHVNKRNEFNEIVSFWEKQMRVNTEESEFKLIAAKDVNNYIAVKRDGTTKLKGAYADPGLSKNPVNTVCIDAAINVITGKSTIQDTIYECNDIRKFITIRAVKGGAVKDGEYLGKAVRWYYAANEQGVIVYANNGNTVARSTGAKPLMLMDKIPEDLDREWYVTETEKILKEIGYFQ